jgi:hypothetical protein
MPRYPTPFYNWGNRGTYINILISLDEAKYVTGWEMMWDDGSEMLWRIQVVLEGSGEFT